MRRAVAALCLTLAGQAAAAPSTADNDGGTSAKALAGTTASSANAGNLFIEKPGKVPN